MFQTRVKVQIAFLVIFLLGFAAGALSLTVYNRRIERERQAAWTGRFDRERFVNQLTDAVGLLPDQMSGLNAILDETREEFLSLRKRLDPQFEEIRQRARNRLRGMLNPGQQASFDTFLNRWDEERRAKDQAALQPKTQERKP